MNKHYTIGDWFFEFVVFKAGLATAVGVGLELFCGAVLAFFLGDVPWVQAMLFNGSTEEVVASAIIFHILGWIITQREWKFITGERQDDLGPNPPPTDFTIDKGNFIIKGNVYRK